MKRCLIGDCRDILPTLEAGSVQTVVTSPPYWGLRDYGTAKWDGGAAGCDHLVTAYRETCGKCGARRIDSQIGLEQTPEEYVAQMVAVFREVRRVLRDDGTLWLNLGSSYSSNPAASCKNGNGASVSAFRNQGKDVSGTAWLNYTYKPKDLVPIPWLVALALQRDGWYLRQDLIWAKPNPMPESVRDRCTKSHEYIFLLSKRERYFFDAEAIAEASIYPGDNRAERTDTLKAVDPMCMDGGSRARTGNPTGETRNKRSVWTVTPKPYSEAHFATFPPGLIEPCIMAGTSEKGCCGKCGAPRARVTITGWQPSCDCNADTVPCVVLDPFGGSGTTGQVAEKLGRQWILIELNPEYEKLSRDRTAQQGMVFA